MLSKNHTSASQNGQNKVNQWSTGGRSLVIIGIVIFWLIFLAQTAFAAGATGQDISRKIETFKVSLDKLAYNKEPVLDWRNPDYDIVFELPTSDWVEDVDLFIRFHAEGRVNSKAPVFIQFNDDDPVPVYARGNSFEARINLDTYYVKADKNKISIKFAKDTGCIKSTDGAYSIDMNDSFLVVKTAIPLRTYSLREAKKILNSPLSSPKTISIKASGAEKLRYQALVAQGMALNLPDLPRFKLDGSADAQIVVGTRGELGRILKGTDLEHQKGPLIGVTSNAPLSLVLTADNKTELTKLVDSFASREMPPARRSYAKGGEFSWQPPMSAINAAIEGKVPLFELGKLNFNRSWGNESQDLVFDIDNPLGASGMLDLTFETSKKVSKDSSVSISLNNEPLGIIKLNSIRKRARLDIPSGVFVGTENRLTISPDLSPKSPGITCSSEIGKSGFAVAARSRMTIKNDNSGYSGDLTRLAASGYPFSNNGGAGSNIVFAAKTNTDLAASLRAFARLGKAYGSGWTNSKFYSASNQPEGTNAHTLFIGPKLEKHAPKGLASVIDGRSNLPRVIKTAEQVQPAISLLSVRTGVTGGVIAIYPGPEKQMKGYITASRGHNFARIIDQIVQPDHWNQLQGSVARWNKNHVQMIKTAFDKTEAVVETPSEISIQKNEGGAEKVASTLPKVTVPEISIPKLSLPEFNLPKIDLSFAQSSILNASEQAKSIFDNGLAGVQAFNAWVFTPKKITNSVSIPAPKTIKQAPNLPHKKAAVTETSARVLLPRIERPVRPISTDSNLETPIISQTIMVGEQYSFGRALRGLADVERSNPSEQNIIPQYQFRKQSAQSEATSNPFTTASAWMSQKLDGLMGTQESQGKDRQANILVFAVAIIFLLLLIALARPTPRNSRAL